LLLIVLGGCASAGQLAPLVLPEQLHLDVRDSAQIPGPGLPAVPAPITVSTLNSVTAKREMSLDEAIHIALENMKVVRILAGATVVSSAQTIYDPAISNTTIDDARAAFDPVLGIQESFTRTDDPLGIFVPVFPLGAIAGTATEIHATDVNVSQRNVLGGTVKLDLANTFTRLHPGLFPLNPQDATAATLSYTQPLLKGAGLAANLAPIVVARLDTERSFYQFKDSVQESIRGVIDAYWNLDFARTDVQTRRQQVEQGKEAVERAEARKKIGLDTAADVAQARTALANFRSNLIAAEATLLQREDILRNILGLPPTEPYRLVTITPVIEARVEPRWEEIVKLADENRPDLAQFRLIIETDLQNLVQARNQAQPQVDVSTFYRWNALEGQTPSGREISVAGGQFNDWSVGVNISVPLGLRQSRADLRRAELTLMRDRANLDQGLHAAIHDLAAQVRTVAQFYEQYKAFKEAREAAEVNLEQQEALFRKGQKAIYLNVLTAIADLGNAISSEKQALAEYNIALSDLERQTGTILQTHGVWFHEDRYASLGPLGRCGPKRCYPSSVFPGPTTPTYGGSTGELVGPPRAVLQPPK
jgi:outer membrane protein TolC